MFIVYFLLLLGAAICFGIAAFGPRREGRVNLVALGLLLFVLVPLLEHLVRLAR